MRRIWRQAALAACLPVMLALAACGGDGGGSEGDVGSTTGGGASPTVVEITMTDGLRFEPATVSVATGETVRFQVDNPTSVEHEFVVGTAELQAQHGMTPSGGGHSMGGMDASMMSGATTVDSMPSIHMPAGTSGAIEVTFDETGTFEYACHLAGHYEAGMVGSVEVA
jgi:uncharacterized cupredoxin-like copper-binding protein